MNNPQAQEQQLIAELHRRLYQVQAEKEFWFGQSETFLQQRDAANQTCEFLQEHARGLQSELDELKAPPAEPGEQVVDTTEQPGPVAETAEPALVVEAEPEAVEVAE